MTPIKAKSVKTGIFYFLLILPALALILFVSIISGDIYDIHQISPQKIFKELESYYVRKIEYSFALPDEIYKKDNTKKTVYLFGESSLVTSDDQTFSYYLASNHNNLNVVNFGISGIDSFSIRRRVEEALAVAKPDLMILYYGHNDFNNAYHGLIIPHHFKQFNLIVRIAHFFRKKNASAGVLLSDEYIWYYRLVSPIFFKLFEKYGAYDIDVKDYEQINQLVLETYVYNNEAILDMAALHKIPVVLITPVGNLRAEPFGDVQTTAALYRKGMTALDYSESLKYLKMARDSEILTYDIRAKSCLVDYIRGVRRPNVYVMDLEKKLEEIKFSFGYSDFLDYFHFNDVSHRLLSNLIYDFIAQKSLVEILPEKDN